MVTRLRRSAQIVDAREIDGAKSDDPVWLRLRDIISLLNACPIVGGRMITEEPGALIGSGVALNAGVIRAIPHKLGRPALGFFEVCAAGLPASGSCQIEAAPFPAGTTSADFIALRATNSGHTFIWVF